jgi:hypothetical protein
MNGELIQAGSGTEVARLLRAVNDREKSIQDLKQAWVHASHSTIAEAILQGDDLIKAKDLCGHGEWLDKLEEYAPSVSIRTVQTYMKLARNTQRAALLTETGSIRQALALLDGGGAQGEVGEPEKHRPFFMEAIYRGDKYVKMLFRKEHPIATYPESTKDKLRELFAPVVKELWPGRIG